MASCENVSLLPTSEEYYAVIDTEKLVFTFVDVVLTVIIFVLFVEEVYFVIKTYKHFNIVIKSIWLISIYPVFAISAIIAVTVPRAAQICDFVSTCYLSACLFQFSSLILLYFGQVEHLLVMVKDTGFSLRARPCCCCCVCCPVLPPVRRSLITVRLMILQTAIFQPIIQFISAVMWADDKYDMHGIDLTDSYFYLTTFKLTSTIVAIYGLNALHESTRQHLTTHNTRPKQLALQLVQIFFNVQGSIFRMPTRYDLPPCKNGLSSYFQMNEWQNLVLVVEMFLLSLMARVYYRRPLAMDAVLEAQTGSLADIYSSGVPLSQKNIDSTKLEALPESMPSPQHEDQNHSVNEENSTQGQSDVSEVQLNTENHVDDTAGVVNPAFDVGTAYSDKGELFHTTARNDEKCSTIQTDKDKILYSENQQNTDHKHQSNVGDEIASHSHVLARADTTTTEKPGSTGTEGSTESINVRL
ncbi:organic solute transporter subunit alpha-like [Babylonia areolata]|uniref:organic solute transporter subunit alpha-like n=1 Tax=Babylonia areolata TaxID=304850 RepID=UPI003FD051CA